MYIRVFAVISPLSYILMTITVHCLLKRFHDKHNAVPLNAKQEETNITTVAKTCVHQLLLCSKSSFNLPFFSFSKPIVFYPFLSALKTKIK